MKRVLTHKRLYLVWSLAAVVLLVFAACSPLGDDDDDDNDPGPVGSPTATRLIIVSTFTPTEVIPPAQLTATAETRQTSIPATQTAQAGLPTPTFANPTVPEEQLLTPPQARLATPAALVDAYPSSYSWQFDDASQTYANLDVPIVQFTGEPAPVANGDQLTLDLYGESYRTPPFEIQVEVYNFDENSAVPTSGQGQGDEPAFAIRTEPDQSLLLTDPASLTFSLDVPPGHYAIRAQGRWGQHPLLSRQIFVTWVFDVVVE